MFRDSISDDAIYRLKERSEEVVRSLWSPHFSEFCNCPGMVKIDSQTG